jgi:hypothetical protein
MKHPHHSCAANALRTLATMDVADSRLELAEAVWRGWLVEGDHGCGIRWEAREDSNHGRPSLPETGRHAVTSDDFRCGHRDSMERQTTLEAIACCDGPCLIADGNGATDPCGK